MSSSKPVSAATAANPKAGFISLGCPKALVDCERILTQLRVEGYDLVPSYDDADVVLADAPEIDGLVQIQDGRDAGLKPGDFADVRIFGSDEHDLFGEVGPKGDDFD